MIQEVSMTTDYIPLFIGILVLAVQAGIFIYLKTHHRNKSEK